jgi:phytoene synthase
VSPTSAELVADSRAVLAKHARSFRLASLFLPAECADEAAVTYAFCRLADDLADEAASPMQAVEDLAALTAELEGDTPARPIVAAYLDVATRRDVPTAAAAELLLGLKSDLGPVRVANDQEFFRYCYRVAGTVGLMMSGVLGVTHPTARAPAVDLGVAMQVTNICRDVLEDAGRDRVYIPATRLAQVGLTPADLLSPAFPRDRAGREKLATVIDDLLTVAEDAYTRAWRGMHHIPARPRLAILVASVLYRDIGRRLRAVHGSDPMHGRTIVPAVGRVRGIVQGLLLALHPVSWGWHASGNASGSPLSVHLHGLGGAPA